MRILWPLLLLGIGVATFLVAGDPFDRYDDPLGLRDESDVAKVAMVAGLLLVLRELHHLWRLRQPGSVDLAPFENATGDDKVEVQALAARVGYRLGALNVFRAPTLPSGSLDRLFVEVVTSSPSRHAKWVSAVIDLIVRVARPRVGHRVTAIALRGEKPPLCGLTATVADAATGKVCDVFTVWRHSHADAADEIAYLVYQAVGRSSAIRGRTPAWARFDAPEATSLKLFHDGVDAEERGDIETAHDLYHAALEAEPANVLVQMRAGNSEELVAKDLDTRFERMLAAAEHYARAHRLWPHLAEPAYRLAISYGFLAHERPEDHVGPDGGKRARDLLERHIRRLLDAPRPSAIAPGGLADDLRAVHGEDHDELEKRFIALVGDGTKLDGDLRGTLLRKAISDLEQLDTSLRFRTQLRRLLSTIDRDVLCALRGDRGGTGQQAYYRSMLAPWPAGVKRRRARCRVATAKLCTELHYAMSSQDSTTSDYDKKEAELERRISRRRRWLCWGEVGWQARYNVACFYGIRAPRDECDRYARLALDHLKKVITDPANRLNMRWLRRDPDLASVRGHDLFTELFSRKSFWGRPVIFRELHACAVAAGNTWAQRQEPVNAWPAPAMEELDRWTCCEQKAWEIISLWAASPEDAELRVRLDAHLRSASDQPQEGRPTPDEPHPGPEPSALLSERNDELAGHARTLAAVWSDRALTCRTELLLGRKVPRRQVARWIAEATRTWLALVEWCHDPLVESRRATFTACVQQAEPTVSGSARAAARDQTATNGAAVAAHSDG